MRAESSLLTQAKALFERAGIAVHGCVCTTGLGAPSDPYPTVSDYSNRSTQEALSAEFAYAAQHFDDIIIDDFYFTSDESADSEAALAAGTVEIYPTASEPKAEQVAFSNTSDLSQAGVPCKWKDMRRTLLLHTATRDILGAAKEVNPNCSITLKFPNWYHPSGAQPRSTSSIYLYKRVYLMLSCIQVRLISG